VARYINFLKDFNYQLKHILGVCNHTDALSHRPDYDNGSGDNEQVVALPDNVFIWLLSTVELDKCICQRQKQDLRQLEAWQKQYGLTETDQQVCYCSRVLVVQGNNKDKKALLKWYHNAPTARHAGVTKTLQALCRDYWWLGITQFIQAYVKGCAQCQESKTITHQNILPI